MDEQKIQATINAQSEIEAKFKRKMTQAITVTVLLITITYLIVVLPFLSTGNTHISMHVVGFVAMILVFPVLTFFAGMWLVWKKKFFPNTKTEG